MGIGNRTFKALWVIMLAIVATSSAGTAQALSAADAQCTPAGVSAAVARFTGFWNSNIGVLEISNSGEYTIWSVDARGAQPNSQGRITPYVYYCNLPDRFLPAWSLSGNAMCLHEDRSYGADRIGIFGCTINHLPYNGEVRVTTRASGAAVQTINAAKQKPTPQPKPPTPPTPKPTPVPVPKTGCDPGRDCNWVVHHWSRDLGALGTHYITVNFDGTYTEQTTVKSQGDSGFTPPTVPPKHGTWVSNGADIALSGLGTASHVGGRQMLLMGKGLYRSD